MLHPLPRVGELDADIDSDRRAVYFEQAAYGVPVRMALIALLLGLNPRFRSAYKRGMDSGHAICRPPGSDLDIGIDWRVAVCCWAAWHGKHLPGDFVECGTNTGIRSRLVEPRRSGRSRLDTTCQRASDACDRHRVRGDSFPALT